MPMCRSNCIVQRQPACSDTLVKLLGDQLVAVDDDRGVSVFPRLDSTYRAV